MKGRTFPVIPSPILLWVAEPLRPLRSFGKTPKSLPNAGKEQADDARSVKPPQSISPASQETHSESVELKATPIQANHRTFRATRRPSPASTLSHSGRKTWNYPLSPLPDVSLFKHCTDGLACFPIFALRNSRNDDSREAARYVDVEESARIVDSPRVVALLRRLCEVVVVAHDPLVERLVELRCVAARPDSASSRTLPRYLPCSK